ncbi:SCO family protein [Natrialba sp. PRR66]|uniref:SCO family protein n=1 Tax=Natrialba sp. PRR66 TaxID=3098146 RepID=UPI002B1D37A3|nr:SCO family protein [Natrialba sp. PRR66]
MERRTYLGSFGAVGAAGLTGLAGCLGEVGIGDNADNDDGDNDDGTILDPPDRPGDPDAISHPTHGQEFPDFSLPDPLSGETIDTADFAGEKSFLLTFFFTSCPNGACPALLLRLRRAQADAKENGYTDDLSLLAMTFDPERDTADTLESYAHEQGVDLEAGNWHFLRPESYESGKELLHDQIGMRIEKVPEEETEHENHDGYSFTHLNLILLVNQDGIVERSYPQALNPELGGSVEQIVDDTSTVAQQ